MKANAFGGGSGFDAPSGLYASVLAYIVSSAGKRGAHAGQIARALGLTDCTTRNAMASLRRSRKVYVCGYRQIAPRCRRVLHLKAGDKPDALLILANGQPSARQKSAQFDACVAKELKRGSLSMAELVALTGRSQGAVRGAVGRLATRGKVRRRLASFARQTGYLYELCSMPQPKAVPVKSKPIKPQGRKMMRPPASAVRTAFVGGRNPWAASHGAAA